MSKSETAEIEILKATLEAQKQQMEAQKQQMENQSEKHGEQMAQMMGMLQRLAAKSQHDSSSSSFDTVMAAKIAKLEETVQKQEKVAATGIDMDKLCLFPNAKLPDQFKPIDWEKFDGTGDPKAHLQTYVGTLSMYGVEKDAMAQMFQQTLKGAALRWFLALDDMKKKSWDDIGAAFIAQYNYNIQLEMTLRELESTEREPNESFADFVKRWRNKASQMMDRPSDKEQMRIITKNLGHDYAKHLVVFQTTADFKTSMKQAWLWKKPSRADCSRRLTNPTPFLAETAINQPHQPSPVPKIPRPKP